MKKMYILSDTFNGREISRHQSLENALKARAKHLRAVKRANGANSYLTYSITRADGEEIEENELDWVENQLIQSGKI